jgi:type VI secretion system protein ImpC
MWEAELPTSEETPFRIGLIGDWSGRINRSLLASRTDLAASRPLVIDRDNLDRVMSKLGVKIHLPAASDGSLSLTIEFNELDDFHPDCLFQRLEIFERLRGSRSRLSNPKTFANEAEELRKQAGINQPQSPESKDEAPSPRGSLLDQILEAQPGKVPASSSLSPEITALAREAVKPFVLPDNDAEREQFVAAVDTAITNELRAILHHPDFRSLESAWRALAFLVSRIETGPNLKLHLLDISRPELEADLLSENEIESTALYKILVEQATGVSGAAPWAVICANFEFDSTSKDAKLLERISMIVSEAATPFIAACSAKLAGCESLAETPDPDDWRCSADAETEASWNKLRQLPGARFLGLALPRFLARLPYGAKTEPTEEIDFEEIPEYDTRHENYLWANPAFAAVYLLAKAFSESGWGLRPGDFQEIEGLPLHVIRQDGESRIKPCAEILMTVRVAEKIIRRGLMPLIWMKDTDVIRLGLFQSIAGTRLGGRWEQ